MSDSDSSTGSAPAPVPFELHPVQRSSTPVDRVLRPGTWDEALAARRDHPRARPVAGGTDLVLELARSSGPPVTLIDLSAIEGARAIEDGGEIEEIEESAGAGAVPPGGHFVLGAGVTHNQVVAHAGLRAAALPLAQACLEIGSPQLRNRATVAGNLATASPANDSISALMALGATVVVSRVDADAAREDREIPVADFFPGFRETAMAADELITAIRVPELAADERGVWVKVGLRRAQAISVVHAGIVVRFDHDGRAAGRLALGSVAPTVVVSDEFAHAFSGSGVDLIGQAGDIAGAVAAAIEPIDDVRASADYRRTVTATVIERALHVLAAGDTARQWPTDPPVLRVPSGAPTLPSQAAIDDESVISVQVNGRPAIGRTAASTTLLDWLRDHSSQPCPGVKEGCAEGECGACTVVLDNAAVMSCLVPAAQADGATVRTVEGLAPPRAEDRGNREPSLHAIQEAFIEEFAVQCGFCIPGFLMASAALLEECPRPSSAQIELGLSGNLCRCTGYYPITAAVRSAGERS